MAWIPLVLLVAFFDSLIDVLAKRTLRHVNAYVVAWSLRAFALCLLLPLLWQIGVPPLGNRFFLALLVGGGLNVATTVFYMKAIQASDLSVTMPMVTVTPLLLLITSPLLIGEFPTFLGFVGILFIVAGAYVINLREIRNGTLAPFRALLRENGPRWMLMVAVLWSIAANFDKIGVQNSSPLFWAAAINGALSLVLFPTVWREFQSLPVKGSTIRTQLKYLILIGLLGGVAIVAHMMAINMTLLAYVVALKRLGMLMSVGFGFLIFKEKGMKTRLAGAIIMLVGVFCIILS